MKRKNRQDIEWRKFLNGRKPVIPQKNSDDSYSVTTLPGRIRVPDNILKKMNNEYGIIHQIKNESPIYYYNSSEITFEDINAWAEQIKESKMKPTIIF